MSLSDAVFAASWAVLCDRFNRHFTDATVKIYRRTLNAELTDSQFQAACAAAFRFETFFPSPQQLIEYGLGGKDFSSRALKRWTEMMERARLGEAATDDPLERKMLMRATNGEPLGNIPNDRMRWVERSWVRIYSDYIMEQAKASTPVLDAPAPMELPHASD